MDDAFPLPIAPRYLSKYMKSKSFRTFKTLQIIYLTITLQISEYHATFYPTCLQMQPSLEKYYLSWTIDELRNLLASG